MTTLKEHQDAMVNLLASGSGIPASASRLAHALYDVLAIITTQPVAATAHTERRSDATTPGLNDKLLALDVEAVRPAPSGTTSRIKQLENTIRQLKGRVEILVQERDKARSDLQLSLDKLRPLRNPEQAGVRKEDNQWADGWISWFGGNRPVSADSVVEVTFRSGRTGQLRAEGYNWGHDGRDSNIVAYRVIGAGK